MIVYHGSYCLVQNPNISFSREALDFGKGFYVTGIKEQAVNWTTKFKRRGKKGILNIYSLSIDKIKQNYMVKEFLKYDNEWLDFILQCRGRSTCYLEYDLIIGGIADDRVYNTIELYKDKLIDKAETLNRLQFYKPNHQICIINQDIINKYLVYKNSEEV
ncbi:DUF3990 domain-containing protein [Vallitalea guaymasensis]|uniref:DUF3990 domain-containing protein n=1 Tax=Vallitalea guaymasensis TaxID=1185412 RepID=A0A8J8SAL5_9FIRM|nr:DUF3990 domain-containing protein [Vallitalea guaymasensis]QUH27714.1 DUF3990 domain-containing protein [Vallitalea guaymasensis]